MSMTRKLLVSAIFLTGALLIYFFLTQRYPISGDDYAYLYQARLFASSKLYAEDPLYDPRLPFYDCLETYCLRDDQGHRFSKYPPGWPVLLAVGVKLRVPWLVNPLLGALLVFGMLEYAERRIGKEEVKVMALLLTLCFFLCYYAASFRAHIAAAVFVFAAFLLYDCAERRPHLSKVFLSGAGAVLGYSAMIRYIDWIPLVVWIGISLLRQKRFVDVTLFAAGFGLLASGNLVYNTMLSGDPFEVPSALHRSAGLGDRLSVSWSGLVVTVIRLANLLWTFPPVFLLAVLWNRYQSSSQLKMYIALFSMAVATYFFYPAAIGGPGPRYFLAYFPFLIMAITYLYGHIRRDSAAAVRHLWNFAIVSLIVGSAIFACKEAYTMYWRRDLDRTAQQVKDGKKIFLLESGSYKTVKGDLTRNPPVLTSADSLYFTLCDEPQRNELLKRFPGRSVFIYAYPGKLTKLSNFH